MMIRCRLCQRVFTTVTRTHLTAAHQTSIAEYNRRFDARLTGFPVNVGTLPHSDQRYRQWRLSLRKRPPPWNTGYTKKSHPSVAKISETFRKKKIDNFAAWRRDARKRGLIRYEWPPLEKDGDTAELIGVVLGDGHIAKFPRTECLTISSNSEDTDFIERYATLMQGAFGKTPSIEVPRGTKKCTRIRIYQKDISKRLGIPSGNRRKVHNKVSNWILQNRNFLIRFLRGLYEAEGSFCIHQPTYTYKFLFANKNLSLLNIVYRGLQTLGFHPHRSEYKIQLSRRTEVYKCKNLLKFRAY